MKTPVGILLLIFLFCCFDCVADSSQRLTIVVLGDSLTAGYGLPQEAAFPARLEEALKRRGRQVRVINAGISGDTSMGGSARLDWSLGDHPDLVIVELGANDALRGLSPQQTRENLDSIFSRLQQNGVQALLTGMKAPRNMGEDFYTKFDRIYPELALQYKVPFYPFFLAGVVGKPELNQPDGIHPTSAGVDVIVKRILPLVEETLDKINQQRKINS